MNTWDCVSVFVFTNIQTIKNIKKQLRKEKIYLKEHYIMYKWNPFIIQARIYNNITKKIVRIFN